MLALSPQPVQIDRLTKKFKNFAKNSFKTQKSKSQAFQRFEKVWKKKKITIKRIEANVGHKNVLF